MQQFPATFVEIEKLEKYLHYFFFLVVIDYKIVWRFFKFSLFFVNINIKLNIKILVNLNI